MVVEFVLQSYFRHKTNTGLPRDMSSFAFRAATLSTDFPFFCDLALLIGVVSSIDK